MSEDFYTVPLVCFNCGNDEQDSELVPRGVKADIAVAAACCERCGCRPVHRGFRWDRKEQR